MTLNERAKRLADHMGMTAAALRIQVHTVGGARVMDCGIDTPGGLQAGLALARVCMAGQGEATLTAGDVRGMPCPLVQVTTDHPVTACMASQYAGWQIAIGDYFAMGSGPMRAAYGHEELFDAISGREQSDIAVGALETRSLPTEDVTGYLADELGLAADKLTLLAAPAASMAGTIQVVARSVETALHKLHELQFDLSQVVSAFGSAPLPPVANDDLGAIGRTNDAILYGGRVVLWVNCEDDVVASVGPKVPSSASSDHGAPFASIFERYDSDFYKIDPMLFSPAEILFVNVKTGRSFSFGESKPDVLHQSFFGGD